MIRRELIAPLGVILRKNAEKFGDKLAFEDASRKISYAELNRETANLAARLQAIGLAPGGRVVVQLPNSVNWVVAVLAAVRAGGIAVPASIESSEAELSYRISDSDCSICIARAEKSGEIAGIMSALGRATPVIVDGDGAAAFDLSRLTQEEAGSDFRDDEDIDRAAFIVYTSGTTGQPKGVLLSTRSMLWVTAACWAPIAGLNQDDFVLNTLPLYHSYALNFSVLAIVATGASEYILDKFSTSKVLEIVEARRFTLMPGVPTIFHYFLSASKTAGKRLLSDIRLCISAGAVMPGALNQEFEAYFGVPLLDGYGITETSTMVTMNWPGPYRVPGSCGLPVPGVNVRIVDSVTGIDVPSGAEGELICRGPNLMLGYHGKPLETSKVLRDGWYHTGDLARCDRDGFLTITGRLKELIIRGGQNIAPAEIEETILQFPHVADCAVIGMAHDALGEVAMACIVVDETVEWDVEALLAHCRKNLSAYKVPEKVLVVPEIPRTASGKIMRARLRDSL